MLTTSVDAVHLVTAFERQLQYRVLAIEDCPPTHLEDWVDDAVLEGSEHRAKRPRSISAWAMTPRNAYSTAQSKLWAFIVHPYSDIFSGATETCGGTAAPSTSMSGAPCGC